VVWIGGERVETVTRSGDGGSGPVDSVRYPEFSLLATISHSGRRTAFCLLRAREGTASNRSLLGSWSVALLCHAGCHNSASALIEADGDGRLCQLNGEGKDACSRLKAVGNVIERLRRLRREGFVGVGLLGSSVGDGWGGFRRDCTYGDMCGSGRVRGVGEVAGGDSGLKIVKLAGK